MTEITKTDKVLGLSVQDVRLLDVLLVAPFCFYVSSFKVLPTGVRAGLFILGTCTLLYNVNNYLKNKQ